MSTTRTRRSRRQDAITAALDELELISRVDPTEPLPPSLLEHVRSPFDEGDSPRVDTAARYGFLSTEELLEDIAAALGREDDLIDADEPYER